MNFLAWWNPLSWLSEGLEKVGGAIVHAVRMLFYMLDTLLYQLIINLYKTFELLCNARLLDNDIMLEISKRIGLILGIVMLFMIIFSFIKMLVDPDTMSDKKNGAVSIIKKTLIVIVMLGSSQFVFDALYSVQKTIIKENIISKIILPYDVDTKNFGNLLSEEVFTSFYRVNSSLEDSNDDTVKRCKSIVNRLKFSIYTYGNFEPGNVCLNESIVVAENDAIGEEQEITVIDYNWLLATVVGIALIYFLFSYCISVGVRMVQLTVLEIISPMAIISYISPKDDTMFKKWTKIYIGTYIDVFIRIAIINFAVFLIATVLDNWDKGLFWKSVGNPTDIFTKGFLMVVVIIALLTFAKKAPDLIKELFPSGASKLGLGGWKMKDALGLQKGLNMAAGATSGAATGLLAGAIGRRGFGRVTGALGGVAGGLFRGGMAGMGAKGIGSAIGSSYKKQMGYSRGMNEIYANGGSWFGNKIEQLRHGIGARTTSENLKDQKTEIELSIEATRQRISIEKREIENIRRNKNILDQTKKDRDDMKARAVSRIKEMKFGNMSDRGKKFALNALKAERQMEILKQQAGNLKVSDFNSVQDYQNAKNAIDKKINQWQKAYNNNIDYAIEHYVNESGDNVITDAISTMQAHLDNSVLSGTRVTDWASIENANNTATAHSVTYSNDIVNRETATTNLEMSIQPQQDAIKELETQIRQAEINERNIK